MQRDTSAPIPGEGVRHDDERRAASVGRRDTSRPCWSRRQVLRALALVALALFGPGASAAPGERPLRRIAFGSCARQTEPQPIWDRIVGTRPELFLFIGDNIYADTEDMAVMRAKYQQLGALPGYRRLLRTCPVLATWDDHDYGVNDAGAEYPKRVESQQVFLEFFKEPADSPRRKRPGVYDARVFGPPGKRVQVILLDTRYFRSRLKRQDGSSSPYVANTDPEATMLGDAQWRWLEAQLRAPAEVRIIASSIQVVPEDHGSEKWMNLPRERERLFRLIKETGAGGVLFISGDRHLAELSMMDGGVGYPLYDLTSSGLNAGSKSWRRYEVNRHRVGTMNWGDNFGMIEIDWEREDPQIRLQVRDVDGDIAIQRKIHLSTLRPGTITP
jgi:alkaline phosphatase D